MGLSQFITRLRIKKWKNGGAVIGEHFQLERNSYLDSSFPWLITIGDNVTIAPDVLVLTHDGSTQKQIGYSKVGKVIIGNNVFIGAKSIVLPNTTIGDNCILAAGTIVSGDIPANSVVSGCPGRVVQSVDVFKQKNMERLQKGHAFDRSYTRGGDITAERKAEMKSILEDEMNGFVV